MNGPNNVVAVSMLFNLLYARIYIIMIILLLCCSEIKSFHVFVHLCLLCHNCRAYGGNYIAAHTHRDIAETKTYN